LSIPADGDAVLGRFVEGIQADIMPPEVRVCAHDSLI